jgi:hypothetical protein
VRLRVAGDDDNTQEAVIFRIVEWAMKSGVCVHLVAHTKKGERDRGAPQTEDIEGSMEIGTNAFNIISVWYLGVVRPQARGADCRAGEVLAGAYAPCDATATPTI